MRISSVKINIYFRDEHVGSGESNGDQVAWAGDASKLRSIIGFYERQGHKGEALLKRLLERLKGNWWAEEAANG